MKPRHLCLVALLVVVLAGCSSAPAASPVPAAPAAPPTAALTASAEDLQAIRQAALDYVEGWYAGDAARMEVALHPDFVKRVIRDNRVFSSTTKDMVDYTRQGGGRSYAGPQNNIITILDVYNEIATVRAESAEYIDYLHIGKVKGKWVLINALWAYKAAK